MFSNSTAGPFFSSTRRVTAPISRSQSTSALMRRSSPCCSSCAIHCRISKKPIVHSLSHSPSRDIAKLDNGINSRNSQTWQWANGEPDGAGSDHDRKRDFRPARQGRIGDRRVQRAWRALCAMPGRERCGGGAGGAPRRSAFGLASAHRKNPRPRFCPRGRRAPPPGGGGGPPPPPGEISHPHPPAQQIPPGPPPPPP